MIKAISLVILFSGLNLKADARTYRLVETSIEKIVIPTRHSYKKEDKALEKAFELEDDILSESGREFSIVKKACWNFVDLVKPTIVRLTNKSGRYSGEVHVKIRCAR